MPRKRHTALRRVHFDRDTVHAATSLTVSDALRTDFEVCVTYSILKSNREKTYTSSSAQIAVTRQIPIASCLQPLSDLSCDSEHEEYFK